MGRAEINSRRALTVLNAGDTRAARGGRLSPEATRPSLCLLQRRRATLPQNYPPQASSTFQNDYSRAILTLNARVINCTKVMEHS